MATALASEPFYGVAVTGDGSFTMNPQILIDGVEHGAVLEDLEFLFFGLGGVDVEELPVAFGIAGAA